MGQTTTSLRGRFFTRSGAKAYDQVKWVSREALIVNPATGKPVFEQKDVEFPESWSQNAINIVAQKYFCGTPGTPERERSLKQLINRVADTITDHGKKEGYFESDEDVDAFAELLRQEPRNSNPPSSS
jgi:ribonucleoside-diphosphate reductase alpha chain